MRLSKPYCWLAAVQSPDPNQREFYTEDQILDMDVSVSASALGLHNIG